MAELFDENTDLDGLVADKQLLTTVKRRWREARQHTRNWRNDAREDYQFVAGDQWSETDMQTLRDQLRPVVTFNRVGPVIDVVAGTEVQNRQEVRYIPREQGDVKPNEVFTGAAQWVRDLCDAEDEESDSFIDMVICGMGWTETRLDYDVDEEGQIIIERVDPFEMYWDSMARKRNLSDARWIMRVIEMEKDELKDQFPDKWMDVFGASAIWGDNLDDESPHLTVAGDQYASNEDQTDAKRKATIKVVEYQWYEPITVYKVFDPFTGEAKTMEAGDFRKAEDRMMMMGVDLQSVKMKRRKYRRAFVAGDIVLDEGDSPVEGFTYKCMTAKRDRNKNIWYGLVRAMKDPQRWANKWLSQTMHIINSNAKGGLLAEQDAFVNPRKAESEWANPTSITLLKPGGLPKVQPKPAITYPSGMDRLMEFAVSSIRDVTGVNVEMLGMREGNQPGILEFQRKQAGITILGTMFDSLRRYRKEQGRILLRFIQDYISDGRLIKIMGSEGEQYVPLARQSDVTFDVIVDDAPTSPNQKEQVFATLSQLLPALLQAGIPIPPDIVEYAPLPSGLIEKWKDMLSQPKGPDPAQVALMQQELEYYKAENQNLKSSEQAKIMKAQLDAELKREELAQQRENDQLTLAQKQDLARQEMDLKRQIAEYDLALERMKIEAQAELKQREQFSKEALESAKLDLDARDREAARQPQIVMVPGSSKRRVKVERDEQGNLVGAELYEGDDD